MSVAATRRKEPMTHSKKLSKHGQPSLRAAEPTPSCPAGAFLAMSGLALAMAATLGCTEVPSNDGTIERVSALVSTATLQLKVLTNSCGLNQAQDFFQVTNTGTTAIKLSDLKIKYWLDDTSGQAVAPHISTGGCASGPGGSPSCSHQVSGVTVAPASFSPACGPDATHQANWEITISDTDSATLAAGATWNNIQTSVNLANFSNFNPGTGKWFSPCVAGSSYVADPHFALYYQGNLVFANGLPTPACRSPQGQQTISGHLTPAILATPIVGPVPQATILHVGVNLPLQNPTVLDAEIAQVSDPSSPTYRHFRTLDNFAAAYGPSSNDYTAVTNWAQSKGLTVDGTYPNRAQLNVSGTVAALEKALNVNMIYRTRPDGTQFYAPDCEPSIDIPNVVSYITQITNFFVPKPSQQNGSGLQNFYLAKDLRNAYASCLPATANGSGQTVGLLGGAGFSLADITQYAAAAGITAPPIRAVHSDPNVTACQVATIFCADGSLCTGTCSSYNCPSSGKCVVSGAACAAGSKCTDDTTVCPTSCPANSGCATSNSICPDFVSSNGGNGSFEMALDIETSMGMAPGVSEVRVFQGANALQDMATTLPLSLQLSTSWGLGPITPPTHDAFREFALQGQSFSAASGDHGAIVDPQDDTDSDLVTVVGGTELAMNGSGASYASETLWAGSSGWIADGLVGATPVPATPIPFYQTGINMVAVGGSNTVRNSPDIALVADDVELAEAGGIGAASGTSIASPLWAGFMALINQQNQTNGLGSVGLANLVLYGLSGVQADYARNFNDILPTPAGSGLATTTNGIHGGFAAFAGYDLATGLGSPKCAMVKQLSSSSPAPNLGVSVGVEHACAIRSNGGVSCWGNDDFGQIGNPAATNAQLTPIPIVGLPNRSRATALAAGGSHTCALLSDKTVWCWGSNGNGELGTPGAANPSTATKVASLSGVTAVASGSGHSCAILSDKTVQCWGENANGQLGNNSTTDSPSPVVVSGLTGVTSIAAGEFFNCVVAGNDAHVECWGLKFDLGNADPSDFQLTSTPVKLASGANLAGVTAVAAGADYACALMQDSSMQCWGDNSDGELGNQSTVNLFAFPGPVDASCASTSPLTGVAKMALGWEHACALLTDGTVTCWGVNSGGELGDGTTTPRRCAAPVSSLTGQTNISANAFVTCALNPFGISCWGDGFLGNGGTTGQNVPATVRFF
jgi:alpha-tubulin suppressor-like RCC1 family protein